MSGTVIGTAWSRLDRNHDSMPSVRPHARRDVADKALTAGLHGARRCVHRVMRGTDPLF